MAILTVTPLAGKAGITPTFTAANAGGDSFANDGKTWLEVNNGGGASITVTIAVPYTVDGSAVTPPTVTIPAGQRRLIGKFDTTIYNDANGRVAVSYSAVTTVTVNPFSL